MNNLAMLLRTVKPKLIQVQSEAPKETLVESPRAPPSAKGPMIEFEKKDGLTTFVHVRSQGRVRTLQVNRDEDGNMVNATLLKA